MSDLNLYRRFLDESGDPIFCFDPDCRYLYANQAFADGIGRNLEEVIGKSLWEVFPDDEATKRFIHIKWVFDHKEVKVFELPVSGPNGDHYYLTTLKPILDDQARVSAILANSKDITERKRMEREIRELTSHDPLTKLPNRHTLNDRLGQTMATSKRSGNYGALMMLDLDSFKQLNDAHGHHAGDLLLVEVARRLTECVRGTDTTARAGGDEFVVILGELNADPKESARQAAEVAEKIRVNLAAPYRLILTEGSLAGCAVEHICSASIGVVMFLNHEASQTDLLKWADSAMYQAKRAGRNAIRFCGLTQ
jgi:diguanylate cyclase (GGDEF)-like protein/PAS domain S-box-containing protein